MVHYVQLQTARTLFCFVFNWCDYYSCDQQLKIWASDIRSSQMFCVPGSNRLFLRTALKSFGVLSPVTWPSGGWSAELPDLQSSGSTEAPLDSNVWTWRAAATLAWHQPLISDDRRETVRDKIIFPSPPSPPTLFQRNARSHLLLFLPHFPKR